jgi:hypothetical protein
MHAKKGRMTFGALVVEDTIIIRAKGTSHYNFFIIFSVLPRWSNEKTYWCHVSFPLVINGDFDD